MQPNMLQDGNTLLTYSLTTTPLPVQVSLSTSVVSLATLLFVVSVPKPPGIGSATVAQITISLPVDQAGKPPDPANLCMTAPPLSSASISSSGTDQWIPSAGASPGQFIFKPQAGQVLVSGQSLTIEFTNIAINTVVGTALVKISEWAVQGSGTPPPITGPPSGTQSVAVAKFPYGFYAGNFTSTKPMVNNGEKPVLSWTGSSNATYLMLYESNAPIDVSNVRSWSPPNGLTQMTTFILQVSAQQAGQTATMDFSITVEVSNPSLVAQDLTVQKASTLKGQVTVGTSTAPADLVSNGNVQAIGSVISSNRLTAKSGADVVGTLTATGAVTFSSTLNVSAAVSLGNTLQVTGPATFNGGLTSNNGLTAGGIVSVFGNVQSIGIGNHTAPTDGFVIGSVFPNSSDAQWDLTITGSCNGMMVQATGGGTLKAVAPPDYYGVTTGGMFILPVKKGSVFSLSYITPYRSTPAKPFFTFYWIPLGAGLASATLGSSLEETAPPPPPTSPMIDPVTRLPIRMLEEKSTASKETNSQESASAETEPDS